MKSIQLNTAAVDNAGRRIEAGVTVFVGPRANQIDADRAKDMVARASASAIRAKTTPKATTTKKTASKAKPAPATKPAAAATPVAQPAANADTARP